MKNSSHQNLKALCHCSQVHFVNNADYTSFFATKIAKLPVDYKITASLSNKHVSQVLFHNVTEKQNKL